MDRDPEAVLKRMSETVLPPHVENLKMAQSTLANGPADGFGEHIMALLDDIFSDLMSKFGVNELGHLGDEAAMKARCYAVECLNGALPPDYPYIVTLIKFQNDVNWQYHILERRRFGSLNELLTPNVVPLIEAADEETLTTAFQAHLSGEIISYDKAFKEYGVKLTVFLPGEAMAVGNH